MTPGDIEHIGQARYGSRWRMPMARETGWSYWTLCRVMTGTIEISPKLARVVEELQRKPRRKQ